MNQVAQTLKNMTTQLGLKNTEQQEFLTYWMERLTDLHSKYILISVFSPEEKEIIDHVDIAPKPDTFIGFIFYYKAVSQPYTLPPISLPTPPARNGFTAVEWGGIIDH
jgi:hypothetical protein